jgi:tetratricopeptide (TPR) repeat protein
MLALPRLPAVLSYLREAETIARAIEDQARLGWARLHVCHLLVLIDDCSVGIEAGRDALAIGEAIGDRALQVVAILWLGCAYYALGEHRQAVDFMRRGLRRLEEESRGPSLVATAFPALRVPLILRSYLGMFLAEMGKFTEAELVAIDALALAERLDHPQSLTTACWQIAHVYIAKGDFQRAKSLLERGRAVARDWGYTRLAGLNDARLRFASLYGLRETTKDARQLAETTAPISPGAGEAVIHCDLSMRNTVGARRTLLGNPPNTQPTSSLHPDNRLARRTQ